MYIIFLNHSESKWKNAPFALEYLNVYFWKTFILLHSHIVKIRKFNIDAVHRLYSDVISYLSNAL